MSDTPEDPGEREVAERLRALAESLRSAVRAGADPEAMIIALMAVAGEGFSAHERDAVERGLRDSLSDPGGTGDHVPGEQ